MLRRAFLALPGALLPATAFAAPGPVRFRVLREGREIGTHQVRLSGNAAKLSVQTEIALQVKLAGFTVFRLRHDIAEDWANDRLQRLTSRHDRNGTVTEARVMAAAGALVAQGPEGEARLPANAAPLTWWNGANFARPLIRPLNCALIPGIAARSAVPGGGVQFTLNGVVEAVARYDAEGRWVALATKGEDGSAVIYELIG
ncbi:MAG: hypothetical protein INF75_06895 [Roseomonas sp.]|nr:hypothetical protein [Roseomonas sp.]MCA3326617.1 hypothetical protein [Roseomonas sp.]MCA3329487.1 hypothetical protein [Roseomonas sp.]MCA3335763.1 hypothetical protein [Roseomonas sp.]MCA3345252.1 hypothetical protein [Roseomonas sp.]